MRFRIGDEVKVVDAYLWLFPLPAQIFKVVGIQESPSHNRQMLEIDGFGWFGAEFFERLI